MIVFVYITTGLLRTIYYELFTTNYLLRTFYYELFITTGLFQACTTATQISQNPMVALTSILQSITPGTVYYNKNM